MKFKILYNNGHSRIGQLKINGKKLETPYLFPVMSFFCGGNWESRFGGGIYRNLKEEFLTNPLFKEYFSGVMTSIAQISDFHISKDKLENYYLQKTIPEWFKYKGILFVDSGGFKILTNRGINGKNFQITAQEEVINYQKRFGADIIVPLDYPIAPNLKRRKKMENIRLTIENTIYLLTKKPQKKLTYLAVHGHSKKDFEFFLRSLIEGLERENSSLRKIDGIAIGSLVPLKSNYFRIVEIVQACKQVLADYSLESLPLHIFGISSSLLPILIFLGVDTFDSTSYIYSAINGVYYKENLRRQHITKVRFNQCNCKVCKNKNLLNRLKQAKKSSSRDNMAPLAVHNLIMLHEEIKKLKEVIKTEDENKLKSFLLKRYGRMRGINKLIKKLW